MKKIKKEFFGFLSKLNKILLPVYRNRDLSKLSSIDKAIVGYKYWVTKNYFE